MSELTEKKKSDKSPAMSDDEIISVLQSSLYPGAAADSVRMVMQYCAAARLDPMQKPVHIVPMSVKNTQTGHSEWRDVIMPGIGLYRIQADRSGTYAGISAPEFGPDKTGAFTDKNGNRVNVVYPEWCRIVASKMVDGRIVEFTAQEYWLENYASDSSKSDAPNRMWRKRPRGQLAKCAEAQALRKAWPEVGAAPTAEEMEGKIIDVTGQSEVIADTQRITEDEALAIHAKITDNDIDLAKFLAWLKKSLGASSIEQIAKPALPDVLRMIDATIKRKAKK